MLLSDRRILAEMEHGNIIIDPFDQQQLGTNSYDVRLGDWFFEPNRNLLTVDFTSESDTRAFWGEPRRADDGIIAVRPGDTILCHTQEVVGGTNGFTTSMRSRSSIGRSCLSVCKCAGVGDVGYVARWTMEITNHSHAMVVLPVGLRVAQILFYEVGPTLREYAGKYGQQAQPDWSPMDMLPKLYTDRDIVSGRLAPLTRGPAVGRMIAAVRGTLEGRGPDHALVAIGGVVLRVSTSATTLRDLGEVGAAVALQTYLYVREDALQLFGFRTTEELRLFETLLGITGIGPRLALSILSFASPAELQAAILAEDANMLARVPGVGRKTAARIILELRGKLTSVGAVAGTGIAADAATADAVEALQALGYSPDEALHALQALGDAGRDLSPEQRVLAALRQMGQGR